MIQNKTRANDLLQKNFIQNCKEILQQDIANSQENEIKQKIL